MAAHSCRVIIIGGGLAGALLANGLQINNFEVAVYERDKAKSKREGYQIRLGEYSFKAFQKCLAPDLVAKIEEKFGLSIATASNYTGPVVYSPSFSPVIDMSKIPTYSISTAINRVVLRDFLLEPLKTRNAISFNKSFSRYEIIHEGTPEEAVQVFFDDGTSDTCDILVGADGSGSKVNKQLGANNLVDIDTHWDFVFKGDITPDDVAKLPKVLQTKPMLIIEKGCSLYCALYLPSNGSDESNTNVLFNIDYKEASLYWGFTMPREDCQAFKNEPTENLKCVLEYTKNWAPEFRTIFSAGRMNGRTAVARIPLRASTKLSKDWRQEAMNQAAGHQSPSPTFAGHPRVWLIGDAIHAMQPNRGMGGNQAMYDCLELLPYLIRLRDFMSISKKPLSTQDIRTALMKFESQMLQRTMKWVEKSGGTEVPQISLSKGVIGLCLRFINIFFLPVANLVFKAYMKCFK